MGCCDGTGTVAGRLNRQQQVFAAAADRAEDANARRRVLYYVDGADGEVYGPWRTTVEADLIAYKKGGTVRPELAPYTPADGTDVEVEVEVDDAGAEFVDITEQTGWLPPNPESGIVGDGDPVGDPTAPDPGLTPPGGTSGVEGSGGVTPAPTPPVEPTAPGDPGTVEAIDPGASQPVTPADPPLVVDTNPPEPGDGVVIAPEPVQDGTVNPDDEVDLSRLTAQPPAVPPPADVDERPPGKPGAAKGPKPPRSSRKH